MCGSDGSFDSMGEGMFCNFDGTVMVEGGGRARRDHHRRSCGPTWCARRARGWGVENNLYQLYHRGYVAVKGGAQDCPYTYMRDMAAGRYRLPWETGSSVTDGSGVRLRAARCAPYKGPEVASTSCRCRRWHRRSP